MQKENGRRSSFHERELVASATECTGLVPAIDPTDEESAAAAQSCEARLYGVHAPEKYDGKREGKCEGRTKGEESARS